MPQVEVNIQTDREIIVQTNSPRRGKYVTDREKNAQKDASSRGKYGFRQMGR